MPTFSSKNMHIAFFNGTPSDDNFDHQFHPISASDLAKMHSAVKDAIKRGKEEDTTVVITLCGDVTFNDKAFGDLIDMINLVHGVQRIVSITTDCIVILTHTGFVVQVRLVGLKQYFFGGGDNAEDSFESVEELTQRVDKLNGLSNMFISPAKNN